MQTCRGVLPRWILQTMSRFLRKGILLPLNLPMELSKNKLAIPQNMYLAQRHNFIQAKHSKKQAKPPQRKNSSHTQDSSLSEEGTLKPMKGDRPRKPRKGDAKKPQKRGHCGETHASSKNLAAVMTLVIRSLCTLREVIGRSGCRCISLSM